MAEKDIAEKSLEEYNDVFADIVNGLLFGGENRVKEEDLSDTSSLSQYKADDALHEQERDVAKFWQDGSIQSLPAAANEFGQSPNSALSLRSGEPDQG